ncbi:hypothetical protein ALC53_06538 [Atta colombica]|uniref:Uncharacterized protein n=1 Tax=Atta colombica TaxID=520822 RepID=A0A195BFL3_9HYME|nr:hypothetical protein ALC53_06538 [Atta colombica]
MYYFYDRLLPTEDWRKTYVFHRGETVLTDNIHKYNVYSYQFLATNFLLNKPSLLNKLGL